jgi:signal transduction histidine kinase
MLYIQKGLLKRLLIRYGFTVSAIAVAYLVHQVLMAYGGPDLPPYITFYPAVMLVATVAGFWSGLVATAVAALVVDYWILSPTGSFGVESFTDIVRLMFFSGMGVFMSLVAEFYRRSRQQAQQRSLELAKANEALRHLSSKLLTAHENERKRIAAEIHDTLGTYMAAIKFKVETAVQEKEKNGNAAIEPLESIIPVIQEAVEEYRRIQQDLRPSILDDLGLLPTLSWFCRRVETIYSHIQTEQTIRIEEGEILSALKIVIYRVAQEAMNNIAKHSKADFVRLSLQKMDGKMELTIQDNGQGFNPEKITSQESTKKGLGLSSMKERTELSGGSFAIESAEGKGTIIRASWPLGANG